MGFKEGQLMMNTGSLEISHDNNLFNELLASGKVIEVIDTCEEQLRELFLLRNPQLKGVEDIESQFRNFIEKLSISSYEKFGSWFHFEWLKTIIHYLPEELHQEIRTARNKNIISNDEQKKFYNFDIGIAGLSVGSHAAITLAMMGGSKRMRLADPDTLSATNLNRVRYNFTQLGKKKSDLAHQEILKINPYAEVKLFSEGLLESNIDDFLIAPSKLGILIEEVDRISLKFLLRFSAKKFGIPVIMATDNGDNVIVDIERYDLEPNLPIFNGLVGDITYEQFKSIPKETLPLFVGNIVGIDLVTPRVFESLSEVGKTLYSWPQLGSAANMSGSILAYLARKIACGSKISSGKYHVSVDEIFAE